MKKIYLYATIIGSLLLASCNLDRDPFNAFTEEQIAADKEAAFKTMLNGTYSQLKTWSDVMHRLGEYPSDNIVIRGTSSDAFSTFITYSRIATNGRVNNFWDYSYKQIAQSSDLLKMFGEGEGKDQELGEIYYLRGMSYFYLCRVFGRPYYQSPETNLGVPIALDGVPKDGIPTSFPDRSTVKEVYAQVIRDLKKAEQLMSENKKASYATKEAAQAMLSRVYLYMSGTYDSPNTMYADSAIYYAQQVRNSGRYRLLDTENFKRYNQFAPDDNGQTETIFAVKRVATEFSGSDHYYGIGGMYANLQGQGWGEMFASAKYLDLLNKAGKGKDARSSFIDPQYAKDKSGKEIPSFRFIVDLKNEAGVQTGYGYLQDTLRTRSGGYYVVLNKKEYPLTVVNATEGKYSINYNGKTYVGDKDYLMLINNIYPMFYIIKCSLQDNDSHLHSPIISRLGELHLNMAEAYAKKGDYTSALTNLNIIRVRSIVGGGYASLDATNAEDRIAEERQLEMAFEADRGYDVYRRGRTMVRRYPGPHDAMVDIQPTDNSFIQYIPQKEINAYYPSILTQNP